MLTFDLWYFNGHGLQEGNAWFVNDLFWPMILGQFGWIGLVAMIGTVYTLFKEAQIYRKVDLNKYAACLIILSYLLVESTSSVAFVHTLSMPLALLLGYMFGKNNKSKKRLSIINL